MRQDVMAKTRTALLLLSTAALISAQPPQPTAFAAASIHSSDARSQGCQYFWADAVNFRAINATVTCLVRFAFDIEDFQIETKQRLGDRAYDINARTEVPVTDLIERRHIMAAFLTERFQLRY